MAGIQQILRISYKVEELCLPFSIVTEGHQLFAGMVSSITGNSGYGRSQCKSLVVEEGEVCTCVGLD